MKDIKIKKTQRFEQVQETSSDQMVIENNSKDNTTLSELPSTRELKFSYIGTSVFTLMSFSVLCYLFMVSSSIFYAVQMNKFTFKLEGMTSVVMKESKVLADNVGKFEADRISYINKDSDTSISLR